MTEPIADPRATIGAAILYAVGEFDATLAPNKPVELSTEWTDLYRSHLQTLCHDVLDVAFEQDRPGALLRETQVLAAEEATAMLNEYADAVATEAMADAWGCPECGARNMNEQGTCGRCGASRNGIHL